MVDGFLSPIYWMYCWYGKPLEDNLIVRLTLEFALLIVDYTEELEVARRYVIANQLSPRTPSPKEQ